MEVIYQNLKMITCLHDAQFYTDGNQDWTEELWLSSDAGWLIFHFVAHV